MPPSSRAEASIGTQASPPVALTLGQIGCLFRQAHSRSSIRSNCVRSWTVRAGSPSDCTQRVTWSSLTWSNCAALFNVSNIAPEPLDIDEPVAGGETGCQWPRSTQLGDADLKIRTLGSM